MPKPFDLLAEFGKFGAANNFPLNNPDTLQDFLKHVESELSDAKNDPNLLNGQRTENMFEALIVSLNAFKLFKVEDSAGIFPIGTYKVPDFRVVTNDDQHWCVEVKNCFQKDPVNEEFKASKSYLSKLIAYSNFTRAELKIAVYWARWSIWTLISPEKYLTNNGGVSVSFIQAMAGNELYALGDFKIGTKAPLKLRLIADPKRSSKLDQDGQAKFVIGDAKLFCDGSELTNPIDQRIAWLFLHYGKWEEGEMVPELNGNRVLWLDIESKPSESQNNGFEIIGSLSTIFTRYFAQQTLGEEGVRQLKAPTQPEWFKIIMDPAHKSDDLPLWKLTMKPNYDIPKFGNSRP